MITGVHENTRLVTSVGRFFLLEPCYTVIQAMSCMVRVAGPVNGVERLSEAFPYHDKPLCLLDSKLMQDVEV